MFAALLSLFLAADRPYPVGAEHGSAVGNKRVGWVHITHRVERVPGGYRYRVRFEYRGKLPRVLFRFDPLRLADEPHVWRLSPGESQEVVWESEHPPVWASGVALVAEYRDGSVPASFRQAGPVPQGR